MQAIKSPRQVRRIGRAAGLAVALMASLAGVRAEGLVFPHPPASSMSMHSPSEYALAHASVPGTAILPLGNYYFVDPVRSDASPFVRSLFGGFRASSGLANLGQPMSLFDTAPDASQNLPYVGLGYTHLWSTGQFRFNADFGLASQNGGPASRGRLLGNGTQTLDDITRELRWAPVMAVNVSYSF